MPLRLSDCAKWPLWSKPVQVGGSRGGGPGSIPGESNGILFLVFVRLCCGYLVLGVFFS